MGCRWRREAEPVMDSGIEMEFAELDDIDVTDDSWDSPGRLA